MTPLQEQAFDRLVDQLEEAALADAQRLAMIEQWHAAQTEASAVCDALTHYFKLPRESARRYEGAILAHYHVQHLIGEGANGAVYLAQEQNQDFSVSREVALKLLHPSYASPHKKTQLVNEIKTCFQTLGYHPHIAPIFHAGLHDDPVTSESLPFFSMPFIKQASNLCHYAENQPFTIEQKLALLLPVCEAVQHAHQRSVIHGDLKPDNILVDGDGQVFVIDFGFAKVQQLGLVNCRPATPSYQSPEHARDTCQHTSDELDDIYALGVILYELVMSERRVQVTMK